MSVFHLVIMGVFLTNATAANAAVGFGQRKQVQVESPQAVAAETPAPTPAVEPTPEPSPYPEVLTSTPPTSSAVSWESISFEEAETALLTSFKKDAGTLRERVSDLVILDVRVKGEGLPPTYRSLLKGKIEQILVESEGVTVRDCAGCMLGRFKRDAQGNWSYENGAMNLAPVEAAGASHAMIVEADYTPENLEMRFRVVQAKSSAIIWSKAYSTTEEARKADALAHGEDPDGSKLGQRLIGEIAFTTVFAGGVAFMPGISSGGFTADMLPYPQVSILFGEKFDRGSKLFGIKLGGMVMVPNAAAGTTLPPMFYVTASPAFKLTFNPWERRGPRWSMDFEVGALVSGNVATAYGAVGIEMLMMERFSVSVMPMLIIPGSVGGTEAMVPDGDSFTRVAGESPGRVGGFGLSAFLKFNW
jgi:hypothetical protein